MAAEGGKHTPWGYRGGVGGQFLGSLEGLIRGCGFARVEASHGMIVRCRGVNFGKGCREGGGGWFVLSQVRESELGGTQRQDQPSSS